MKLSEIETEFEKYEGNYFFCGISEKFYKKEFKDIKDGELMGMIFDGYRDINIIGTSLWFEEDFNNDCIHYIDICTNEILDTVIASIADPIWSGVPLIVKKINNHQVEEILSGEIFEINQFENKETDWLHEELYSKALKNKKNKRYDLMQKDFFKYRENNFLINYTPYIEEDKTLYGHFIKIDDEYKRAYAEITLENREEIVSIIKEVKKASKEYFEECLKDNLDIIQSIANVDNVLYDVENKTKKELKMNLK